MKTKTKILCILLISSIVFITIGFAAFSWLYYSGRINTYQPISVKCTDSNIAKYSVIGISPFGRKIQFVRLEGNSYYSSYSYYKQVEIQFDIKNKIDKHNILLVIGNERYKYIIEGNKPFIKPIIDRGSINYWRAFFSPFHWDLTKKIIKLLIVFICICVVYLLRLKFFTLLLFIFTLTNTFISKSKHIFIICVNIVLLILIRLIKTNLSLFKSFLKSLNNYKLKFVKGLLELVKGLTKIIKFFLIPFVIIGINIIMIFLFLIIISYLFNNELLWLQGYYCGLPLTMAFIFVLFIIILLILFWFNKIIKLKKITFYIAIIFQLSLCFSFIILEVLLRFIPNLQTYNEKNGLNVYASAYNAFPRKSLFCYKPYRDYLNSANEFSYLHKINSLGLRNDNILIKKPKKEFRIIALGDSFTEGVGTSQDSTWPVLLEKRLNSHSDSLIYKVINAGISGSDPIYSYQLLKRKMLKYKPDLVLFTVNFSDINDINIRGGNERFKNDGTVQYNQGPKWEWLFAMSYLTRLVSQNLLKYNSCLIPYNKLNEYENQSVYKIYECINAFQCLGKIHHFKSIMIVHPYSGDFSRGIEFPIQTYLNKYFHYLSQDYINLYLFYKDSLKINASNVSKYYWKIDGHHNSKGYNAFACGVEWKLKEMGIIDSILKK